MFSESAVPATRRGARIRFVAVHGAVAAAIAVWLIARYGAGLQLHTPGFAPGQHPASLGLGLVAIASAVASVAAWGAVKLIERTSSRPGRAWIAAGLLATVVSLSAPLAGHGITLAERLTLVGMHLAVAAVLIPAFALTISRRRPAATAASVRGQEQPVASVRSAA
ncbi:MAG TPA: DUF6069 family protein [Streptosporangiaceae bacterium]